MIALRSLLGCRRRGASRRSRLCHGVSLGFLLLLLLLVYCTPMNNRASGPPNQITRKWYIGPSGPEYGGLALGSWLRSWSWRGFSLDPISGLSCCCDLQFSLSSLVLTLVCLVRIPSLNLSISAGDGVLVRDMAVVVGVLSCWCFWVRTLFRSANQL